VQLSLTLFELPSPPTTLCEQLDPEARAEALEILARMIAQALSTSRQKEIADE
jgi:hypothetical protein